MTAKFDLESTFVLLPRGTPSVDLIDDQGMAGSIRSALRVAILPRYNGFNANVKIQSTPVDLGFDTAIRCGGVESPGDSVACAGGQSLRSTRMGSINGLAQKVDLIFRANPSVAAATVDETTCWQGEITLKDLPVVSISPQQHFSLPQAQRPATKPYTTTTP